MKFTLEPTEPVVTPTRIYLEMRSGAVAIRATGKNGQSWGIAKLLPSGHLQLNRSIPKTLGFVVDKQDGTIATVKE